MAGKQGKDLALSMLRTLPRVALNNIRNNPGANKPVSIILMLHIYTSICLKLNFV